MVALLIKILKIIWKIIQTFFKWFVIIVMYLSFPLVFFSGERRFVPLKDYKGRMTDSLWKAVYKGILYILWGSTTIFYGYYTYFVYKCLNTYGVDIFKYDKTTNYKIIIGCTSWFIGALYFFLTFTLIRRTNLLRKIGMISVISNIGRFGILFVWISILVVPLYINNELQKGYQLQNIEIINNVSDLESEELVEDLDNEEGKGISERWHIVAKYYDGIYFQPAYKKLVKEYMWLFSLVFFIKIFLIHFDQRYIKKKVDEMNKTIHK